MLSWTRDTTSRSILIPTDHLHPAGQSPYLKPLCSPGVPFHRTPHPLGAGVQVTFVYLIFGPFSSLRQLLPPVLCEPACPAIRGLLGFSLSLSGWLLLSLSLFACACPCLCVLLLLLFLPLSVLPLCSMEFANSWTSRARNGSRSEDTPAPLSGTYAKQHVIMDDTRRERIVRLDSTRRFTSGSRSRGVRQ